METKKTIDIGFAANENYALPLGVCLHSIISHLSENRKMRAWIVVGDLSSKSMQRIERIVESHSDAHEIHWVNLDTRRCDGIAPKGHLTKECFFRLLLADHLVDLDRLIYLDCDLLVRTDLSELWEQFPPKPHYIVGAVQGYGAPYAGDRYAIPNYLELGIPPMTPVFNSGVMTIQLKKWRDFATTEKCLSLALGPSSDQLIMADQTAINIVLREHWHPIHPTWNVMLPIYEWQTWKDSEFKRLIAPLADELIRDPKILHFTSGSKPWNRGCQHPKTQWFLDQLRDSRWFPSRLHYWFWQNFR